MLPFFIGLCFFLAVVCFAVWFYQRSRERLKEVVIQQEALMPYQGRDDLSVPDHWDEFRIQTAIQLNQNRPPALAHYIESVMTRFITGQDAKTVQRRTALLESWIKALKSQGEYYSLMQSLKRLRDEEDIKDLETQIRKEELLSKKGGQAELNRLQLEIEKKKKQLELARLDKDFQAESGKKSEDDIKMEATEERSRRDVAFKIRHTILKGVTTIAEIQKAEDEETARILGNRSLTPDQQREQLKQLRYDCEEARQQVRTGVGVYEDD